jgi:hypothetical protein
VEGATAPTLTFFAAAWSLAAISSHKNGQWPDLNFKWKIAIDKFCGLG